VFTTTNLHETTANLLPEQNLLPGQNPVPRFVGWLVLFVGAVSLLPSPISRYATAGNAGML
jgi:hypothetical protein